MAQTFANHLTLEEDTGHSTKFARMASSDFEPLIKSVSPREKVAQT